MGFADHLCATDRFGDALPAGQDYIHADEESEDEDGVLPHVLLDRDGHPSRRTVDRSHLVLDAVSLLLDRRRFAGWVEGDLISSIHAFSDGSPVTGEEIQGMCWDVILHDRSVYRHWCPGVTLPYGYTTALDKTLAFLWVVYLMVGANMNYLQTFGSKLRSITTDLRGIAYR